MADGDAKREHNATAPAKRVATTGAGQYKLVDHYPGTRHFMTVEEAVQLVSQAGAIGRSGETLVLDMGNPSRTTTPSTT